MTRLFPVKHIFPRKRHCCVGKVFEERYFLSKRAYGLRIHGDAMGSAVIPIMYNISTEHLEQRALTEANDPLAEPITYADGAYTVLKTDHAQAFTECWNMIYDDIKWTIKSEVCSARSRTQGHMYERRWKDAWISWILAQL